MAIFRAGKKIGGYDFRIGLLRGKEYDNILSIQGLSHVLIQKQQLTDLDQQYPKVRVLLDKVDS